MPERNLRDQLHNLQFNNLSAQQLSFLALFIAFTAVATFINVPGPSQSYFNLSEIAVYVVALTFGKKAGFIAGATGPALMDIILGYSIWAPFTFIIKGLEGFVVGSLGEDENWTRNIMAILIGGHLMIVGYAVTKGFLISWAAVLPEIWIDYAQMIIGGVVALPLAHYLNSYFRK
jgi:uncharacterized membrane protein